MITSSVWPYVPKIAQIGPVGSVGQKGEISCSIGLFFLFLLFLPSSREHIFGSIAAFFALDDVFRWGLIS